MGLSILGTKNVTHKPKFFCSVTGLFGKQQCDDYLQHNSNAQNALVSCLKSFCNGLHIFKCYILENVSSYVLICFEPLRIYIVLPV